MGVVYTQATAVSYYYKLRIYFLGFIFIRFTFRCQIVQKVMKNTQNIITNIIKSNTYTVFNFNSGRNKPITVGQTA